MGRRAQASELGFGSDSFLDVICNIVGILIILIVIVAVKVERQPIVQAEALVNTAPAASTIPDRESEFAQRQSDLDAMKQQHGQLASRLQELSDRKAALHREHDSGAGRNCCVAESVDRTGRRLPKKHDCEIGSGAGSRHARG